MEKIYTKYKFLKKYGKTLTNHTVTPLRKTYTTDYYTTQQKPTCI